MQGVILVRKARRVARVILVPKEFLVLAVLLVQPASEDPPAMLGLKELPAEREKLEDWGLMEKEVLLEKMVKQVLRGEEVNLGSEVIREFEARWESQEFLERRDLRVILERKAQEDCEDRKDLGV